MSFMEAEIRSYLERLLPTGEELQRLVAGTGPDGVHPNRGWVYDADLGFVHAPSVLSGNGVNGTNTYYDYEENGARKLINCADRPCRVHTYGDSFTHCDQVNDGETCQEYLAAHLREPIRNYGVGGYSVYQAYRRMCKVRDAGERSEYIILNIFDDDHYRNLVSWHRPHRAGRIGPSMMTRPHLRADVGAKTCVERGNPIATADDLSKLRDLDFVLAEFGEDPLVYLGLATETEGERSLAYLEKACERFGLTVPAGAGDDIEAAVEAVFTEVALFSTQYVVELVERFCADNGIELLFALSYRSASIRTVLGGDERFDQGFVDWLKSRPYPVVDMGESFKTAFEHSTFDLDTFVERYYVNGGHHTPTGNAFTAWAMMDEVVDWLDPKPLTYQSGLGV
jgi:hypothetical protein